MKLKVLTMLLLAFTALHGVAQDSAAGGKNPKIEFEKDLYDFGDIDKGEKVSTVFKFKNTGDAPLEIKNVATSCGCTSAKPEKTVYAVGETGEIPVTFNSDRFSGNITKRVTITTNDERAPKTVVTIKGNVVVDIVSKPVSIFFTKAKMGKQTSQEVTVSANKLEKLQITNIKVEPEFLKAELVPVDDKNAKIVLTADGTKFPEGKSRLNGFLTYETNSATQKTIRTTVTINIERPIRVSPNSVYFFASKAGKKREASLQLISTEDSDFAVKDIKSDLDYIQAKMQANDGNKKTLVVTLSEKAPEGKFQGTVTLTTDIAAQSQVVIPIRGSVIK